MKLAVWTLLLAFFTQTATATSTGLHSSLDLFQREQLLTTGPSEYVFRNSPDETLMPVYLVGAVAKPGLYHLPVKTDLTILLAIAGGGLPNAKFDEISIKRQNRKEVEKTDFEKIVRSKDLQSPILEGRDVIFIPAKEPAISQDAMLIVSLVSGILGIALSSYAVYRITK